MNDFSELEKQLRELKPAQPSADLVARIEYALGEEASTHLHSATTKQASTAGLLPRERRFHFNWLSLGLGLAAGLCRRSQKNTLASRLKLWKDEVSDRR